MAVEHEHTVPGNRGCDVCSYGEGETDAVIELDVGLCDICGALYDPTDWHTRNIGYTTNVLLTAIGRQEGS
jgi:hypothetical protein